MKTKKPAKASPELTKALDFLLGKALSKAVEKTKKDAGIPMATPKRRPKGNKNPFEKCVDRLAMLPIVTGVLAGSHKTIDPIKSIVAKAYIAGYRMKDVQNLRKDIPDPIRCALTNAMFSFEFHDHEDPQAFSQELDSFLKSFANDLEKLDHA